MPLRLDALTKKSEKAFLWIVDEPLQNADDAFSTAIDGKTFFLASSPLIDSSTGRRIGKYVFTGFVNTEKMCNELLDLDIVLDNAAPKLLQFNSKLPQSSDSNEYYEANPSDSDHQFVVETVDRYTIPEEIEGTEREVFLSAFPFSLSVFKSEKDFNKSLGFKKPVTTPTGQVVNGFSTTFTCPGNALTHDAPGDRTPYSFVCGEVVSLQDVVISFGSMRCKAYLVLLHTAMGDLPTLVGKEVFKTKKIAVGRIVTMYAYIKADFVKGRYPKEGVSDDAG